jgi:glycosyltransferase involved in cell wall biosynthesis
MKISVIICTHNRSELLSKALDSVAASKVPDSIDWEILVVDNNSNDQTRAAVDDISRRHPGKFNYIFESNPGKSFALNTGVRNAKGDVIAFMDDDVTVEPAWLANLTAVLEGDTWAGTGGRTLPANKFSAPRWLAMEGPYNLGGVVAAQFNLGDAPVQLREAPFGANMAVCKKMFEKYGYFRTDLGPSPNSEIPRPNEDTEFGRRLMSAGERLRYEPDAIVYHPVLEARMNQQYLLTWWFDLGRAGIRELKRRPDVWGIPRYYFTSVKIAAVLLLPTAIKWLTALNPQRRFYSKCWVWSRAGQIVELYRMGKNVKPYEHIAAQVP